MKTEILIFTALILSIISKLQAQLKVSFWIVKMMYGYDVKESLLLNTYSKK